MTLARSGKTKEAIGEFQEGVALTPKNPDMRLALGLALLKDGNKNAALIEFKKVVELDPDSRIPERRVALVDAQIDG